MGKPTPRTQANTVVHLTPQKAKKQATPPVTPIAQCKGKGFLKPEANALVVELLSDRQKYPTNASVAKRLGMHASSVSRMRARFEAGGAPVEPQVRTPPPSPVSDKLEKMLETLLKENEEYNAVELRELLESRHDIKVTARTVLRVLTDRLDMDWQLTRKVPAKYVAKDRLAFAKRELARIPPNGFYYVFMDESWINATHRRKGRFVKKGSKAPPAKAKERFVPKVNTFACLCEDRLFAWDMPEGTGERGGVTKADFQGCIFKWIGPLMANFKKWAGGREVRLMLDGAAIHGKEQIIAWAKKHGASMIPDWPAHSPDLNPIENTFTHIKDAIGKELQIYWWLTSRGRERTRFIPKYKRKPALSSLFDCHAIRDHSADTVVTHLDVRTCRCLLQANLPARIYLRAGLALQPSATRRSRE
jgi:transposase